MCMGVKNQLDWAIRLSTEDFSFYLSDNPVLWISKFQVQSFLVFKRGCHHCIFYNRKYKQILSSTVVHAHFTQGSPLLSTLVIIYTCLSSPIQTLNQSQGQNDRKSYFQSLRFSSFKPSLYFFLESEKKQ